MYNSNNPTVILGYKEKQKHPLSWQYMGILQPLYI